MAKVLTNVTGTGQTQIGAIMRRTDAPQWFGTFFCGGTYGGTTVNWQWQHANDSNTSFPLKDLGGNAVTSSSASGNDSFNSEFGTGKNNSDHIKLFVNLVGGSGINLNIGYYDNQ